MIRALPLLALLALAGCAGSAETRSEVALGIACDNFAAVLERAAIRRKAGELPPQAVSSITSIRDRVKPFCGSDAVVESPGDYVGIVRTAVATITDMIRR